MNAVKTVKSFIRETKARLKGDTSGKIAERNFRTADGACTLQIAALNMEKMKAERVLDKAQETYEASVHPTEVIENDESYLSTIQAARKSVVDAEKALEKINNSITFFEDLQKKINEEVEDTKSETKEEK